MARPKNEDQNERFTLFANTDLIYKLDQISLQQGAKDKKRITRTDLVNEALGEFVTKWEKKHGVIKIPA
jgi:hypothetical protein